MVVVHRDASSFIGDQKSAGVDGLCELVDFEKLFSLKSQQTISEDLREQLIPKSSNISAP
jgi:hypothetical protein